MHIDSFSISAIAFAVLAFITMIVAHLNGRREYRQKLAELAKRMDELKQTQTVSGLHTREYRELCCSIHDIYPQVLHGVDYHIGDDGDGPYISEWLYEAPQPDEAALKVAIQKHREEMQQSNNYREYRRAAYPSIEDQLDAIHKARDGDDSHLQVIERHIRKVKEKYPKGKKCDHTGCK